MMNEDGVDESLLQSNSDELLSGRSLVQVHTSSGKSLPKDGSKDFSPTNSWMEKKQIQSALDERKELLIEKRVEKWSCLAGATWNNKKKLAEVTRRVGKHFQTLGFEKDGILYLYPEEALYLLEMNCLELSFGGVPVSIQQGYSLLLGRSSGCTLIEYKAYSHLVRQGYKLLRFSSQKLHTKYERTIRLDQHVPIKRSHPALTISPCKNITGQQNPKTFNAIKAEDDVDQGHLSRKPNDGVVKEEVDTSLEKSNTCLLESSPNKNVLVPLSGQGKPNFSAEEIHSNSEQGISQVSVPIESENLSECSGSLDVSKECGRTKENLENIEIHYPRSDSRENLHQSTNNLDSTTEPEIASEVSISGNNTKDKGGNHQPPDEAVRNSESTLSLNQGNSSNTEGVEVKAYGIAESLMSIGNVLIGKESSGTTESSNENISMSLQSEIIKVLGSQLKAGVSNEDLASVAASAANTILSHFSSVSHENAENNGIDHGKHGIEDIARVDKFAPESDEHLDFIENVGDTSNGNESGMKDQQECAVSESNSGPVSPCKNSNFDPLCEETTPNTSGTSIDCTPSLIDNGDKIDFEEAQHSQNLKRTATSVDETGDCEPVVVKRVRVTEVSESEIEILDVLPEEKHVELVNLSDESSVDSSDAEQPPQGKDDIEVIDVLDSTSCDSSENSSTSSGSDSSVVLEWKETDDWNLERKRILETIPNMYSLPEIFLEPPRQDLLPNNVVPQRRKYCINRSRLLQEHKESVLRPSYDPDLQIVRSTFNFASQEPLSQQMWAPHAPINPIAAVQAVAQLVLPMLGIPPNAFPPQQMWMPNNQWFQPRPVWSSGSRLNQRFPRGNNWHRSRPRPYGYRHFTPRYHSYRRGSNHNNKFRSHLCGQNNARAMEEDQPRIIELSSPSTSCNAVKSIRMQEFGKWHDWKQRGKQKIKVPKNKNLTRGRYFNPPRKYSHVHALLKEGSGSRDHEIVENPLVEDSSNESDSSDDDNKSGIINDQMEVLPGQVDSEKTDGSSNSSDGSISSPSEVKPLLSPHNCTNFASVFKSVQVIKEADTRDMITTVSGNRLKPQFDLFSPSKPFRKGSPPVPDFHLCIMRHDDDVPAPGDVQALSAILDDDVPIQIAVVSPDTVSFFQFCNVRLPCMSAPE